MEYLFIILAVLFVALLVLVPLVEKYGNKDGKPPNPKLMKWIFPLARISHKKAAKGRKKRLKVVKFQDLTQEINHKSRYPKWYLKN